MKSTRVFNFPETYTLVQSRRIPEMELTAYELRHKRSGARVLLLPNGDPNKVFFIAFRTPPENDCGTAHILEHSVLCGSERFPVKDPFDILMKSSVNTFLNAFTYPEKTVYPVASCNGKDFANLMDVYMDAVLHPMVYREERIFRQEGWHYELADPDAPLGLNGVVYSEMQGDFNSPDEILLRYAQSGLFPDTPYRYESGGDPAQIPQLDYESFLAFHKRYYHPSNSYLFLYGDCDMEERLRWLDKAYLAHYDAALTDSALPLQKRFRARRRICVEYPVSAEQKDAGCYYALNLGLEDATDIRTARSLGVLDTVLLQNNGSPLREALVRAGLGKDVAGGLREDTRQMQFLLYTKDAPARKGKRFREVVTDTLEKLAQDGIPEKALRAAISAAEFSTREADFGATPKGLIYGLSALSNWVFEGDPFRPLFFEEDFVFLKEQIGTGYYENLIRRFFLENPHGVWLQLKPSPGKAERDAAQFMQQLQEKKASLSAKERAALVKATQALKDFQEEEDSPEQRALIPQLSLSDLSREERHMDNRVEGKGDFLLCWRPRATRGVVYLNLLFPCRGFQVEDIPCLGLLRALFGQLDTARHSYADLASELMEQTGGCGLSLELLRRDAETDPSAYRAAANLSVKFLYAKKKEVFAALEEILLTSRYEDTRRVREVLEERLMQLREGLIESGNSFAVQYAAAAHDAKAAFGEQVSGITQYRFLEHVLLRWDKEGAALCRRLAALSRKLYTGSGVAVNLTLAAAHKRPVETAVRRLLEALPANSEAPLPITTLPVDRVAFTIPGTVGFAALAGRKAAQRYSGALRVLQTVLSTEYLWQRIRVLGGAYGCGASFTLGGTGNFFSYRDPAPLESLAVIREIPDYVRSLDLDRSRLEGFLLSTVSAMDVPLSDALFGEIDFRRFLEGVTQPLLHRVREEVFSCTTEDLRSLAPYLEEILRGGTVCAIAGRTVLAQAEAAFDRVEKLL